MWFAVLIVLAICFGGVVWVALFLAADLKRAAEQNQALETIIVDLDTALRRVLNNKMRGEHIGETAWDNAWRALSYSTNRKLPD